MAREVKVAILGDARDFARAVDRTDRDARRLDGSLGKLGRGFGSLAKSAAIGVAGLGVAGVALGKGFVDAAVESRKVTAQTDAVIKSMGGTAKVTARQVADLSTALSLKSGIDDELIQSGSNVLLTFGKIRNEVGKGNKIFDRATQAALDMSVALGTDMKAASMQVGKALNDPIRGLTTLRRAGIQFTEQQEDQIKAMVAVGDTAGAQKVMLEELERQFGGSAAAQATAMDRLKVAWGNVQEQLGEKLLPVVEKVATWLSEHLPGAMEEVEKWADQTLIPALKRMREWFEEKILPTLKTVGSFIVDTLVPNLVTITDWITSSDPIMKGLGFVVGVTLTAAFLAWAASALAAAAATAAALFPVVALVGGIALLTLGTQWLIDKFNLLPKASKVFQFVIDNGIVPLINQLSRALDYILRLKDGIEALGNFVFGAPFSDETIERARRGQSRTARAQGGMVPGGLGQPRMILAHGGEQVVTHGQQLRAGSGGGSNVVNIYVSGSDPTKVVEAVSRYIKQSGQPAWLRSA